MVWSPGLNKKGERTKRVEVFIHLSLLSESPGYEQAASSSCCHDFPPRWTVIFPTTGQEKPFFHQVPFSQAFHHRNSGVTNTKIMAAL